MKLRRRTLGNLRATREQWLTRIARMDGLPSWMCQEKCTELRAGVAEIDREIARREEQEAADAND